MRGDVWGLPAVIWAVMDADSFAAALWTSWAPWLLMGERFSAWEKTWGEVDCTCNRR